jgi:hypothetical protein
MNNESRENHENRNENAAKQDVVLNRFPVRTPPVPQRNYQNHIQKEHHQDVVHQ